MCLFISTSVNTLIQITCVIFIYIYQIPGKSILSSISFTSRACEKDSYKNIYNSENGAVWKSDKNIYYYNTPIYSSALKLTSFVTLSLIFDLPNQRLVSKTKNKFSLKFSVRLSQDKMQWFLLNCALGETIKLPNSKRGRVLLGFTNGH